jgi:hypothetical protein
LTRPPACLSYLPHLHNPQLFAALLPSTDAEAARAGAAADAGADDDDGGGAADESAAKPAPGNGGGGGGGATSRPLLPGFPELVGRSYHGQLLQVG